MGNDIAASKTFEERMFDQFRANVGSLLNDEEMKKIVEKGMEKLFFEEKRTSNGYNREDTVIPPLAYRLAEKMYRETMEKMFDKWMCDNSERILQMMEKQMSNENLQNIMMQMFSQMFMMPIQSSHDNLRSRMCDFAFQNNLNPGDLVR